MITVQPAEFRIDLEVTYQSFVIFVKFVRQNPADMRPPESSADWRVDVVFIIRVAVMVSMMRRPPKDALLRAGLREKRHQKLEGAAELVRPMTEVAVVARSRAKRAKKISRGQKDDVLPAERNKENQKTGDMKQRKRNDSPKLIATQHKRNGDHHIAIDYCQ